MPLQDFNDTDNTIRSAGVAAGRTGLGRTLEAGTPILVAENDAVQEEFTTYIDVTSATGHNAGSVPVIPRTTSTAVVQEGPKLQLPQFDFATGVSSCASCTPMQLDAKVAAANAAAVVTPMSDAPKSINWLLIAGALGIGYFFLKGGPSGMGNPPLEPSPAPTVQDLGRPAGKPKSKSKLKHVASLTI